MESNNEKQEIDLMAVLLACANKISKFCTFLGHFFANVIRLTYHNWKIILVFMILGCVFAFFWSRPWNRKYQMETEVRINVLDAFYFHDLIANLDQECKNHDYFALSKDLNLSADECKNICETKSFFYIDKLCDGTPDEICYGQYVADTTKRQMEDRLLIRLIVKDTTNFSHIQKALQYYFDKNPLVLRSNEVRMESLDGKITNLQYEKILLDSLRKNEYFHKKTPEVQLSGSLFMQEKDKQLYHGEILKLEKDRVDAMNQKCVYPNSVNFVSEFILMKVQNNFLVTVLCSLFFSYLLGLLFALLLNNKKKIVDFLNKE